MGRFHPRLLLGQQLSVGILSRLPGVFYGTTILLCPTPGWSVKFLPWLSHSHQRGPRVRFLLLRSPVSPLLGSLHHLFCVSSIFTVVLLGIVLVRNKQFASWFPLLFVSAQ